VVVISRTLSERSQDVKLIQRVAELEQIVLELRSNQAAKLSFGNIVLDGTGATGTLTANSGTVIDNSGLNSLANFRTAQLINASSPNTSSTTYIDVPGSTMSTLTLARNANVLIYFSIGGLTDTIAATGSQFMCQVSYDDGGTSLQNLFVPGNFTTTVTGGSPTYNNSLQFAFFMQFVTLAAGSHTFKLRMQVGNGNGVAKAYLTDWLIGYIVFGD